MLTSTGAFTTAVGSEKLIDVWPARMFGTPQYCPGTRSCRLTRRLVKAPAGWAAARVTVNPTSVPPRMLVVERVSGGAPLKHASAVCCALAGRVRQPMVHACDSVQLFWVKRGPPPHL